MKLIRLNITDRTQTINGEIHADLGDFVIAALAAEPETIEEMVLASERFIEPHNDRSLFHGFHRGENLEPCDAGVLVIDLAARVVAVDSSYSSPSAEGQVLMQIEFSEDQIAIPYQLSDDWMFVRS
ncbi:MAG: hypothetical protein L0229_09060, partial [Blastocatellia bacterium]|nr:hypothetical protein [Blastocatellia bacterium]